MAGLDSFITVKKDAGPTGEASDFEDYPSLALCASFAANRSVHYAECTLHILGVPFGSIGSSQNMVGSRSYQNLHNSLACSFWYLTSLDFHYTCNTRYDSGECWVSMLNSAQNQKKLRIAWSVMPDDAICIFINIVFAKCTWPRLEALRVERLGWCEEDRRDRSLCWSPTIFWGCLQNQDDFLGFLFDHRKTLRSLVLRNFVLNPADGSLAILRSAPNRRGYMMPCLENLRSTFKRMRLDALHVYIDLFPDMFDGRGDEIAVQIGRAALTVA